ncbi:MAG TPA: SRPBCC family protein [Mycobacteriales bacterium]|jgi:hypothetical protein|nr:SRPBCC family protein [Mycobacteriales bacterium]
MSDVEVSTRIGADPADLWSMVSDLPRMGEWSPENTGGRWIGGATAPVVGARFKGSNKHGIRRWSTTVTVTEAEPGRRFAFDVDFWGVPISEWVYDFVGGDGATEVVESWTDRRPAWMRIGSVPVMGVADRAEHNRRNMERTLAALKAAAES